METIPKDIIDALKLAQRALNTAPRFMIPSLPKDKGDSYKVAAIIDAAVMRAEKPSPRNTPRFRVVIDKLTDGSQVGAIVFHCDYDDDNIVQIDCEDVDKAQELCDLLNERVTEILVTS